MKYEEKYFSTILIKLLVLLSPSSRMLWQIFEIAISVTVFDQIKSSVIITYLTIS
jgi:hypothetical protein